jgi:aspartokinase
LVERIKSNFSLENILEEKSNLVAIIITSPQKIVETPGCVTSFYNALSRVHINIEETLSCSTETIMVLQLKDVGKALAALTNVISEARKMMEKLKSGRNSKFMLKVTNFDQ